MVLSKTSRQGLPDAAENATTEQVTPLQPKTPASHIKDVEGAVIAHESAHPSQAIAYSGTPAGVATTGNAIAHHPD